AVMTPSRNLCHASSPCSTALTSIPVAYSRVSTFSGDYLRVTDNKGKKHDVLTGSDDGRHSNTSLAWGAGVQFNPTESVAIDIAYEGSGSGDWRTDGFIVGVGYKF
ncbi:Ail/Lom family outer membrane beta-barrel protein, partial [Escherichia coli]|uniref:Ail/Lom family outer membrane beta-barrel protein n=1 Tax=Escherichia coli TaxID=562 RepID=UPI001FF3C467